MNSSHITLALIHCPGNPRNSEGSFITLRDGRILFVYTHYDGDSWDDHAPARLCARFSSDQGETWTSADQEIVAGEGLANVMSVSLLRLQSGEIAMLYLRKNSGTDCLPYLRLSRDEGTTWSEAKRCIPAEGYFVVNNDRLIQLNSGRLVIPAAYHRIPRPGVIDGRGAAFFYLSDDRGETWREAADWWAMPERSGSGLQEPGVVELQDGALCAYCRTDRGRQYELISTDGGEHWTAPRSSSFIGPCAPLSIKRIPFTGELLAVWNDHSGRTIVYDPQFEKQSWGRTPLVTAISRDEGRNWDNYRAIESDPRRGFCYCAIHFVDRAVLLAYCGGGGNSGAVLQDLYVRKIELDWLRCSA